MKFGESPDLKKEKERAAALSSTMRDSLVSFQSVRRAFGDRISQQNSRWKELAPHSQEEEDACAKATIVQKSTWRTCVGRFRFRCNRVIGDFSCG